MIQSIFSAAYIKGVAVGKEWFSAKLFYNVCYCFCVIGTEKCKISRFSEVDFNGSIFSFKINVVNTGSFNETFQFIKKSIVKTGTQICVVNFRFFHKSDLLSIML